MMSYRWWPGKKQALGKGYKIRSGRWAQAKGKKRGRPVGRLHLGILTTLPSVWVRCSSTVLPTYRMFSDSVSTVYPFCLICFFLFLSY